ncbi:MAG: GHKL domain-containing protein [Bacteroidetes bacterium]|nr:MAG: GHKL domain-containing protein [Bacteroidota bacterium]
MLFLPRMIAFLLAGLIAVITTAFLSLIDGTTSWALFVTASLSFSSAFILVYITLEFLIFKEINNIYTEINKINDSDIQNLTDDLQNYANPFRKVNKDIIEYANRKQREVNDLKNMEVFRREFIADISHELKTPLFAAQGFVLTLLDGAVDDRKVRYKFLRKAAKSLQGLSILVNDLVTLSQIENGDIVMHFDTFDVQQSVTDIFDMLEDKAAKKYATLKIINEQEDGIYVHADYNRIMQVLTNLILNAIKYSNENCMVEVKFEFEKNQVQISVSDNGIGIPEEDLKRIFERFYRVEKSRSKKQGGSGLGLSIVKHILEKHNTEITVVSEVNKGTTFSFKLVLKD